MNVSSGDAELIFTDTVISSLVSPVGQSYRQSGAEQTVFCFHQNISNLRKLVLYGLLHFHNVIFTVGCQDSAVLLPVAEVGRD